MGIESNPDKELRRDCSADEHTRVGMTAKWFSIEFVQEKQEYGKPERRSHPEVPVSTPGGIRYVPGSPEYTVKKTMNVDLSPMDQLAEFLNKHGEAILDWEIVYGNRYFEKLPVLYLMEVAISSETKGDEKTEGEDAEEGEGANREQHTVPSRLIYRADASGVQSF